MSPSSPTYPPIAEHGVIGDLQTAALVSTDGDIDWWCTPRFDSPSLFASLLDHAKGGRCRLAVDREAVPGAEVKQLYLPDTAIVVTRFLAPGGVAEIIDFMIPDTSAAAADRHRIMRVARVVRGRVPFVLECRPRFDYGRATHRLTLLDERTALLHGPAEDLCLHATDPVVLRADDQDVTARFTLDAGETATVVLTTQPTGSPRPRPPREQDTRKSFDACRDFWYDWLALSHYAGRWQQIVHRSAITLKLLTYHPTGAPIAAATMGLPEQVGGERNWDYRYTWIRDGSLSVHALLGLGFEAEALAFRRWVRDRIEAAQDGGGEPLQIMYRIDGDPHLSEEVLPHWEGYRGSAPVRAGNAAADQLQLDIYGEAAYAFTTGGGDMGTLGGWQAFSRLVDWLTEHWDRPDEGIWETRGGRQDFTYSRLMCWVAFDRAVRIARTYARPAELDPWEDARAAIAKAGLKLLTLEPASPRNENNEPVRGLVVVAEKT